MRLLAVGGIVIEQGDLFAFELGLTAFALPDEAHDPCGSIPVVGNQWKQPRKYASMHGVGAAITKGNERDFVYRRLVDQRVCDAGRHRMDGGWASRSLRLQALVAFHAFGVVVLG